ncbi:MAG: hypothetical protein ACYSWU_07835 [Planctomycetota bacterium]
MQLNKTAHESLAIYVDGIRDAIRQARRSRKKLPKNIAIHQVVEDIEDYPALDNPGVNFLVGWITGAAEAMGVPARELIRQTQT